MKLLTGMVLSVLLMATNAMAQVSAQGNGSVGSAAVPASLRYSQVLKSGDKITISKKSPWVIPAITEENKLIANWLVLRNSNNSEIHLVVKYDPAPYYLASDLRITGDLVIGQVVDYDRQFSGSIMEVAAAKRDLDMTVECRVYQASGYNKDCSFNEFVETLNQSGATLRR
ncbi:MAG: hypothetical protein EOP06_03055 [Proteobacteria bacterium]|nr:MAG: hypothetical protein EOP06_03055 [Pseudomonadota bacterium]